jgi:hypothetical protein
MIVHTLTSHVADQVAAAEASSVQRRQALKPLIALLGTLTIGAALYFGLRGQVQLAVVSGGGGLLVLLLLGVIALAGPDERDVAIKRAGAAGESVLPHLLRALPDSYTLLNGVPVPGARADIDHVLIGPNGIWAIEAKHHAAMRGAIPGAVGTACRRRAISAALRSRFGELPMRLKPICGSTARQAAAWRWSRW